jgi:hypothetical protein
MATLLVVLLTLLAVANGFVLTYFVLARMSLPARVCGGAVVGLAALAWLSFLVALIAGMGATTIAVVAVILTASLIALSVVAPRAQIKSELAAITIDRWGLGYYAAWTVLLAWLFGRVVTFSADGLHTAPANNYGDLPFHFSVITSFADGGNLPPRNPIFAGLPFTYPFLIDFLTAFFRRAGADWPAAFFIENLLLALALVGLIEILTIRLTGNRLAARLAPPIFLFNGGFGFIYFFRDLAATPASGWLDFFLRLPRTYTLSEELHLRWGNIFTTLLIPQRSLLFGLPVAAMIIALWWLAVSETEREGARETRREAERGGRGDAGTRGRYLLAAGVLAGLLPLLHAHGFFSIMLASGALALLFWSRQWLAFFLPALILSAPQALWLSGTQVRGKLFEPHFGWEAGELSLFTFWLLNAGAFLLLLLAALLSRRIVSARARRFYLPFILCFVVPNVVLLAPWPWDNIKVLIYWYLASCPLAAAALARLWERRKIWSRLTGALLLLSLTLSGALDVGRALSPAENNRLFGQAELEVAELIRQRTPPRALILHAPIHNSVVALTGRQSFMAYPGHLWTHGIDYAEREQEVRAIYHGGALAAELLAQHRIDYLVIGPAERQQLRPDESFFAARYPVAIEHAGYRVYQVGVKPPMNTDGHR